MPGNRPNPRPAAAPHRPARPLALSPHDSRPPDTSRRHIGIWAFCGSLILFLLICSPASAITESVDIVDIGYEYNQGLGYSGGTGYTNTGKFPADTLFLTNAQYLYDLNAIFYRTNAAAGYRSFPENPQSFTVNYQIGDNIVGSGRYGTYLENRDGLTYQVVWLSFDDLDISGYSGSQTVKIVNTDTQGVFPQIRNICNPGETNGWGTWDSSYHRVYIGYPDPTPINAVWRYAEIYYATDFKNSYTISETINGWHDFYLQRQIDGKTYPSTLYLSAGDSIISGGATAETSDIIIENIQGTPITVSIKSTTGKWYNETFDAAGADPDESEDIVTVYIKNSQTGALLAGAHILIEGTPGVDNWTEYVNTTLPSGTGSYSLPGMPYQFRILAESPGYTSTGYQYFRAGDTVIVDMEPYIDAPTNESNTFLEFYIRDLNANPLGGATVEVGGQWLYSNNNGYARFEVAKNATYPYTVQKSGYMTISGTATVADGPRYTVYVVLGAGTVPTLTPTPTEPGATPTPDRRTNEEKGQAVIDMIADNAEGIGALALICLLMGLLKLMVKW